MFIKVTNALPDRLGDPLLVNVNAIVSVYENHVEGGSLSTIIYSNDKLFWTVEESLSEVEARIENALRKIGK